MKWLACLCVWAFVAPAHASEAGEWGRFVFVLKGFSGLEDLQTLDLSTGAVGDAGVAALVRGRFPRLVALGLGSAGMGVDGLRALTGSPFAPQLMDLHLSGCKFRE